MATMDESLYVGGTLQAKTLILSQSSVFDRHISDVAEIATSKMYHRYRAVANIEKHVKTAIMPIHSVLSGRGAIPNDFSISIRTAPTSSATVTVDLQSITPAGVATSLLSAALALTSSSAINTPIAGTLSTSLVAQDTLLYVVTTAACTNAVQTVGILGTMTSGTFTITAIDYLGVKQTTVPITYDVSSVVTIQSALDTAFGTNQIVVGSFVAQTASTSLTFTLTFSGSNYAAIPQDLVLLDTGSLGGTIHSTVVPSGGELTLPTGLYACLDLDEYNV
jgi:hypothetical protein